MFINIKNRSILQSVDMKTPINIIPIVKVRSNSSYLRPITKISKFNLPELNKSIVYNFTQYDVPMMNVHSERHSQR